VFGAWGLGLPDRRERRVLRPREFLLLGVCGECVCARDRQCQRVREEERESEI